MKKRDCEELKALLKEKRKTLPAQLSMAKIILHYFSAHLAVDQRKLLHSFIEKAISHPEELIEEMRSQIEDSKSSHYIYPILSKLKFTDESDRELIRSAATKTRGLIITAEQLFAENKPLRRERAIELILIRIDMNISAIEKAKEKKAEKNKTEREPNIGTLLAKLAPVFANADMFINFLGANDELKPDIFAIGPVKRVFDEKLKSKDKSQEQLHWAWMRIVWILFEGKGDPTFTLGWLKHEYIEDLIAFEKSQGSPPAFLKLNALIKHLRALRENLDRAHRQKIDYIENQKIRATDNSIEREERLANSCREYLLVTDEKVYQEPKQVIEAELSKRFARVIDNKLEIYPGEAKSLTDKVREFIVSFFGEIGRQQWGNERRPTLEKLMTLLGRATVYLNESQRWQVWSMLLQNIYPSDANPKRSSEWFNAFLISFKQLMKAEDTESQLFKRLLTFYTLLPIQSTLLNWAARDHQVANKQKKIQARIQQLNRECKAENPDKLNNIKNYFVELIKELSNDGDGLAVAPNIITRVEKIRDRLNPDAKFNVIGQEFQADLLKAVVDANLKFKRQIVQNARRILKRVGMTAAEISDDPAGKAWSKLLGVEAAAELQPLQQEFRRWLVLQAALGLSPVEQEIKIGPSSEIIKQYYEYLFNNDSNDDSTEHSGIRFEKMIPAGGLVTRNFLKHYLTNGNMDDKTSDNSQAVEDLLNQVEGGFVFDKQAGDFPDPHTLLKSTMGLIFTILRPTVRLYNLDDPKEKILYKRAQLLERYADKFLNRLLIEWNRIAHEKISALKDKPKELNEFVSDLLQRTTIVFQAYYREDLRFQTKGITQSAVKLPIEIDIAPGDTTLDGSLMVLRELYMKSSAPEIKTALAYVNERCFRAGSQLIQHPPIEYKAAIKGKNEQKKLVMHASTFSLPDRLSAPFEKLPKYPSLTNSQPLSLGELILLAAHQQPEFEKSGYDLALMLVKSDLDIEKLLGENKALHQTPILFKEGDKFSIYGLSPEGSWKLTRGLSADKLKGLMKEYHLYLMSKFDFDKCKEIKGSAVVLTDENIAYFIIDGNPVIKDDKPQIVKVSDRQGIAPCNPDEFRKVESPKDAIDKIIQEATLKGGHAQFEEKPKILVSNQVPKKVYKEITLKKGHNIQKIYAAMAKHASDYAWLEFIKNMITVVEGRQKLTTARTQIVARILQSLAVEKPAISVLLQNRVPSVEERKPVKRVERLYVFKKENVFWVGYYNVSGAIKMYEEKPIEDPVLNEQLQRLGEIKDTQTITDPTVLLNIFKCCMNYGAESICSKELAAYARWISVARLGWLENPPDELKDFEVKGNPDETLYGDQPDKWLLLKIKKDAPVRGQLAFYEQLWSIALPFKRKKLLQSFSEKSDANLAVELIKFSFDQTHALMLKPSKTDKAFDLVIDINYFAKTLEERLKSLGLSGCQLFGANGLIPFKFDNKIDYQLNIFSFFAKIKNPELAVYLLNKLVNKCHGKLKTALTEILEKGMQNPLAIFQAALAELKPFIGGDDSPLNKFLAQQLRGMDKLASVALPADLKEASGILQNQMGYFLSIFAADDQEEIRAQFLMQSLEWAVGQWQEDNRKIAYVDTVLKTLCRPDLDVFEPEQLILSKLLSRFSGRFSSELLEKLHQQLKEVSGFTPWTLVEEFAKESAAVEPDEEHSQRGAGLVNLVPFIDHHLGDSKEQKQPTLEQKVQFLQHPDFMAAYDTISFVSALLRMFALDPKAVVVTQRSIKRIQFYLLEYIRSVKQEVGKKNEVTVKGLERLIGILQKDQPVVSGLVGFAHEHIPLDEKDVMAWYLEFKQGASKRERLVNKWHEALHEKCLSMHAAGRLRKYLEKRAQHRVQVLAPSLEDKSLLSALGIFSTIVAFAEFMKEANQRFEEVPVTSSDWQTPIIAFLDEMTEATGYNPFREGVTDKRAALTSILDVLDKKQVDMRYALITDLFPSIFKALRDELNGEMGRINISAKTLSAKDNELIQSQFSEEVTFLDEDPPVTKGGRGDKRKLYYYEFLAADEKLINKDLRQARCERLTENCCGIYEVGKREYNEIVMRPRIKTPLGDQLQKMGYCFFRLFDKEPTYKPVLDDLNSAKQILVVKKDGKYELRFLKSIPIIKKTESTRFADKTWVKAREEIWLVKVSGSSKVRYKLGFCKKNGEYVEKALLQQRYGDGSIADKPAEDFTDEDRYLFSLIDNAKEGKISIRSAEIYNKVISSCQAFDGEFIYRQKNSVRAATTVVLTDGKLIASLEKIKPGIINDPRIEEQLLSLCSPRDPLRNVVALLSQSPKHDSNHKFQAWPRSRS